jgi:hypothetical protein
MQIWNCCKTIQLCISWWKVIWQLSVTCSECGSLALVTQQAKSMRRIILSSLSSPSLQHFATLSHKRYDFRGKVTEHKMCVFIFPTTFVWDIFRSKKSWVRYDKKCTGVQLKSGPYFNMSNLFTKIYNMLYYTTNLYLQ